MTDLARDNKVIPKCMNLYDSECTKTFCGQPSDLSNKVYVLEDLSTGKRRLQGLDRFKRFILFSKPNRIK